MMDVLKRIATSVEAIEKKLDATPATAERVKQVRTVSYTERDATLDDIGKQFPVSARGGPPVTAVICRGGSTGFHAAVPDWCKHRECFDKLIVLHGNFKILEL